MKRWTYTLAAGCTAAWLASPGLSQYVPSPSERDRQRDTELRDNTEMQREARQRETIRERNELTDRYERQRDRIDDSKNDRTMQRQTWDDRDHSAQPMSFKRMSRLIGCDVEDSRGRSIGEIENLALDANSGKIAYLIVSADGRMIPVPWQTAQLKGGFDDKREVIALNVDRDSLRQAPTIRRGQWQELNDDSLSRRIHQHFNVRTGGFESDNYGYVGVDTNVDSDETAIRRDTTVRERTTTSVRRNDDRFVNDRRHRANDNAQGGYAGGVWVGDGDGEFANDRRGRADENAPGGYAGGVWPDERTDARDRSNMRDRDWENQDDRVARRDEAKPGGYAGGAFQQHDQDINVRDRGTYVDRDVRVQNDRSIRRGESTVRDRDIDRTDRTMVRDRDSMRSTSNFVMADDLLDSRIQSNTNNRLGDVEDLLISHDGRVSFVVLSSGGTLGMGERYFAVPFNMVQMDSARGNDVLVVNLDQDRLREAPSFSRNELNTIGRDPTRLQETYAFYGVRDGDTALGYVPPDGMQPPRTRESNTRESNQFQNRDVDRDRSRDMRDDQNQRFNRDRNSAMTSDSAESIINNWPQESQQIAKQMIQKYGQPKVVSSEVLMWKDNGPWASTMISREEIRHDFPTQHNAALLQCVKYDVPAERVSDLMEFNEAIVVDSVKGTMSARSNSEAMNILALNLAQEVCTGERNARDAREFFKEQANQIGRDGQGSTEYSRSLRIDSKSSDNNSRSRDNSSRSRDN